MKRDGGEEEEKKYVHKKNRNGQELSSSEKLKVRFSAQPSLHQQTPLKRPTFLSVLTSNGVSVELSP